MDLMAEWYGQRRPVAAPRKGFCFQLRCRSVARLQTVAHIGKADAIAADMGDVHGLAIIFDIRDLGNDAPGLRTVPIVFGVKGAKALSVLLLLISAAFEWIFLQGLGYNVASYTILAGYVVAMLLAIRANPGDKRLTFDLLVDGMMILIPVCVWVGMKLG